jgi:hypothetical protein
VTAPDALPLEWLARGYIGAYDRLHDAMRGGDPQTTFVPLFETLSWLDTLMMRSEVGVRSQDGQKLIDALRFARGRLHHQWLPAIELRDDVRHPPVRIGLDMTTGELVDHVDPNIYVDWCWVAAARVKGRDPKRRKAYAEQLAGKPVRFALGRFRDFAGLVDMTAT